MGESTQAADRLYRMAMSRAIDAAGGVRAWRIIGGTFRQALVAREILTIVTTQDAAVPAPRVRSLTEQLSWLLSNDEGIL